MDVDTAKQQVQNLIAEMTTARDLAAGYNHQVVGLQAVIRGYLAMYPELGDLVEGLADEAPLAVPGPIPRGTEAVRQILQSRPGYRYYVSEVVEEMKTRGWLPDSDNPANAVRTALDRLTAAPENDVYKGRFGGSSGPMKVGYTYDPDRERPDPTASPSSGYGFDEEPF